MHYLVMEYVDGLDLYKKKNLRPFRKALASCLELHQKTMFNGKSELEHFERRKQERSIKRQKASERYHQKNYIASTALRKGRVEKLEKLKQAIEVFGPVMTEAFGHAATRRMMGERAPPTAIVCSSMIIALGVTIVWIVQDSRRFR